MRLHDFAFAPNPRKVRTYLAEKGLDIPRVQVDITRGEQREPGFLERNPAGALPVLELDDGSFLTESLAIIEYLEELHPDPPMIGTTPRERARTRELERFVDTALLGRVARIFFNTSPVFAGGQQLAEAAEQAREGLPRNLEILDARIGDGPFVAGARPSIADCTLHACWEHARLAQVEIPDRFANLHAWRERFLERPSARA